MVNIRDVEELKETRKKIELKTTIRLSYTPEDYDLYVFPRGTSGDSRTAAHVLNKVIEYVLNSDYPREDAEKYIHILCAVFQDTGAMDPEPQAVIANILDCFYARGEKKP